MTEYLTLKQLITIACRVTASAEPPVRDWGLLESALARPQANIFGADAYPTVHEKVAALMHSLARNHALIDGNKRLAFMAAYMMYSLNGYELDPPSVDDGEEFVLAVARGDHEVPEIAKVLATWAAPFG
ncbi:type II toxin-antitoxin system death-on-curing family toxin [Glycomyces paridis]|uniref:Type II toxin-antitoxin system death-on-curing family toxin n=1 Tax=Glycomyces paridis TaxID=2126555 RepID=A0A4S8PWW0_9ACTN|nr:type II toxin-antitoxin system death-on-curing family toxin [Glycomyces paridis]THV32254.1 type II toxin-antitoxin system death-on-curing family toxin [Glycomyces paridis]